MIANSIFANLFLTVFWLFPVQETSLSNVAHITPPKGSKSMTWTEHYSYMLKNFKISPTLENDLRCYNSAGVITIFWDSVLDDKQKEQAKSIKEIKESSLEAIDELGMSEDVKLSRISKFNGVNYSLSILRIDDSYVFNFDSEYKNYKAISGRIACKEQDFKKAEKIFKNLLKSIKFK